MKLLLGLLLFLITMSCSKPIVYKPNSSFTFLIKNTKQNKNDTLILIVTNDSWNIFQNKCIWKYSPIIDSLGSKTNIKEMTGIVDKNYSFPFNLFFPSQIWLHPPRNVYLRMTELVPFPKIIFPIEKGQIIPWSLTPKSGWDEFEGITIIGQIKVIDRILFTNPIFSDLCWVLETYAESEIGTYKSKYYFHEKYGFVYLFYDFNDFQVELSLIDAKISE